jgi:hypothetical protein
MIDNELLILLNQKDKMIKRLELIIIQQELEIGHLENKQYKNQLEKDKVADKQLALTL